MPPRAASVAQAYGVLGLEEVSRLLRLVPSLITHVLKPGSLVALAGRDVGDCEDYIQKGMPYPQLMSERIIANQV
jgi:hypothetical protein